MKKLISIIFIVNLLQSGFAQITIYTGKQPKQSDIPVYSQNEQIDSLSNRLKTFYISKNATGKEVSFSFDQSRKSINIDVFNVFLNQIYVVYDFQPTEVNPEGHFVFLKCKEANGKCIEGWMDGMQNIGIPFYTKEDCQKFILYFNQLKSGLKI